MFDDVLNRSDSSAIKVLKIISSVPYENKLDVSRDVEDYRFVQLLKQDVGKYCQNLQCSSSKLVMDGEIYYTTFVSSEDQRILDDTQSAVCNLRDMLYVSYLSTITGDDAVIRDYLNKVQHEKESIKHPIKGVYEHFLQVHNIIELLKQYNGLPQSMFVNRWDSYRLCRLKDSGHELTDSEECKMLSQTKYCRGVSEWSRTIFEEIKATQERQKDQVKIQEDRRAKLQPKLQPKLRARLRARLQIRAKVQKKVQEIQNNTILEGVLSNSIEKVTTTILHSISTEVIQLDTMMDTMMDQIQHHAEEIIEAGQVSDTVCNKIAQALSLLFPQSTLSNVATSSSAVSSIERR